MKAAWSFVLACALIAAAADAEAAVARDGQVVMGTVLQVTVVAGDEAAAVAMASAVIEEARRWDDALTIWREDGELARLNAAAGQGSRQVGDRLLRGLASMLDLSRRTRGAFDPAVGALSAPDAHPEPPFPAVQRALTLDGHRATLERGNVLDPGGIGKGLALDAMASLLRRRGVVAAFLDFGGSSQTAIGAPPGDDDGWTILLSAREAGAFHGTIHLRDASLSSSRSGADDTTPILDPRSGLAVPAGRLATVRGASAAAADAWSTALVVLGRTGLEAVAADGVEGLVEDAQGLATTAGFGLPR